MVKVGTPNILFRCDQIAQIAKFPVADPTNHHQVGGAKKGAVFPAMLDDSLRDHLTYTGKLFKFSRTRGIDIYLRRMARGRCLRGGVGRVDGSSWKRGASWTKKQNRHNNAGASAKAGGSKLC